MTPVKFLLTLFLITFLVLIYNTYTGYILILNSHEKEFNRTIRDYGVLVASRFPGDEKLLNNLDSRFYFIHLSPEGEVLSVSRNYSREYRDQVSGDKIPQSGIRDERILNDGSILVIGMMPGYIRKNTISILVDHTFMSALPSGLLVALFFGMLYFLITHRPMMSFMKGYYDHTLNLLTRNSIIREPVHHVMDNVFIHNDVKKWIMKILSLDSEIVQKYSHFETFARRAALENDKENVYQLLWQETSSFMPLKNLSFLELNHSANFLEAVYQHPKIVYEKSLEMIDPGSCRAYRYRQTIIHDCEPRECEFFQCNSEYHYAICVPVQAGGNVTGVARFDVDHQEIGKLDYLPGDWGVEEKIELMETFLSPFIMYSGVIIENIEQTNRFKNQAISDSLTGLYNRRYLVEVFQNHIEIARRKDTPVACCVIDVDDFKRFNDEYGHKVGDSVLRVISRTIQKNSRAGDIVGRFGGEEFLIVLPGSNVDDAQEVAERIRAAVSDIDYENEGLTNIPKITISIGIAAFPIHGYSHYHITNAADKALYKAKQNGKNKSEVHFSVD